MEKETYSIDLSGFEMRIGIGIYFTNTSFTYDKMNDIKTRREIEMLEGFKNYIRLLKERFEKLKVNGTPTQIYISPFMRERFEFTVTNIMKRDYDYSSGTITYKGVKVETAIELGDDSLSMG